MYLEGLRKTSKASRTVGVTAEIRTKHRPKRCHNHYRLNHRARLLTIVLRHSHDRRLRRIKEPQFGADSAGWVRNFKRQAKCQVFCATRLAVGRNTARWLATTHPNNAPVLYPLTEDRRKTTLSDYKGRPVHDLQDMRREWKYRSIYS